MLEDCEAVPSPFYVTVLLFPVPGIYYSQYMYVWASNKWTFGQTDAIALLPPLLVLAYSNLILLRAKRFTDVSIRY